jgi:hypothetical protein
MNMRLAPIKIALVTVTLLGNASIGAAPGAAIPNTFHQPPQLFWACPNVISGIYQGVSGLYVEPECIFGVGDLAYFGNSRLTLQSDGNLVIYALDSGRAAWSSGSYGSGGVQLKFQSDGNLVIYDSLGRARWSSNTYNACGGGTPALTFQEDGNLVIYCLSTSATQTAVWSTNTWIH